MNVTKLVPAVKDRHQFTYEFHKFVPVQAGCYALTTYDGHVLYVGLTDDLHRRFGQHRDDRNKCSPTPQGVAFWFYYLLLSKAEINKVEHSWLNANVDAHGVFPLLNKINSPLI